MVRRRVRVGVGGRAPIRILGRTMDRRWTGRAAVVVVVAAAEGTDGSAVVATSAVVVGEEAETRREPLRKFQRGRRSPHSRGPTPTTTVAAATVAAEDPMDPPPRRPEPAMPREQTGNSTDPTAPRPTTPREKERRDPWPMRRAAEEEGRNLPELRRDSSPDRPQTRDRIPPSAAGTSAATRTAVGEDPSRTVVAVAVVAAVGREEEDRSCSPPAKRTDSTA